MRRVLLFGAAWVVLLVTFLALADLSGWRSASIAERRAQMSLPPSPPRVGARYPGWTVTRAYSVHHMMVVEVETDRAAGASRIAAQLVEPLKDRYDEVLIYIREPGQRAGELPARRVQWTKRAGYKESVYGR